MTKTQVEYAVKRIDKIAKRAADYLLGLFSKPAPERKTLTIEKALELIKSGKIKIRDYYKKTRVIDEVLLREAFDFSEYHEPPKSRDWDNCFVFIEGFADKWERINKKIYKEARQATDRVMFQDDAAVAHKIVEKFEKKWSDEACLVIRYSPTKG